MAQVLAIATTSGLDAVIVAAELAMENSPPLRARQRGARRQYPGAPERAGQADEC